MLPAGYVSPQLVPKNGCTGYKLTVLVWTFGLLVVEKKRKVGNGGSQVNFHQSNVVMDHHNSGTLEGISSNILQLFTWIEDLMDLLCCGVKCLFQQFLKYFTTSSVIWNFSWLLSMWPQSLSVKGRELEVWTWMESLISMFLYKQWMLFPILILCTSE